MKSTSSKTKTLAITTAIVLARNALCTYRHAATPKEILRTAAIQAPKLAVLSPVRQMAHISRIILNDVRRGAVRYIPRFSARQGCRTLDIINIDTMPRHLSNWYLDLYYLRATRRHKLTGQTVRSLRAEIERRGR